jgi:hypothetical protein
LTSVINWDSHSDRRIYAKGFREHLAEEDIVSKGTREEKTGRNRIMRAFFIFKLTKYYTDNKIKKEKKNRSLNTYGEGSRRVHGIAEKSGVTTIRQSFMLDVPL